MSADSPRPAGGVSPADKARVVNLLLRDVTGTLGGGHEAIVEEAAARVLRYADTPDDFEARVVDDVQQWLHDAFIDTTWPRCPEHPRHPLWYVNKAWTCEESRKRLAPLGGLAGLPK